MKIGLVVFVFCVMTLAGQAFGQKFIEKPYTEWGKEDTLRLVKDSAWAKPYQSTAGSSAASQLQISREQGQTVNSGGSNPRSVARDLGPPPVTMRLHSSITLRHGFVRLQQLDAGYDKFSAEDKAKFDEGRKKFLECAICKDYYVISLIKSPDSSRTTAEEGIFQGMTLDDVKGHIKLVNDRGEERELIQFNAPKGPLDQANFYFKRTDAAGNEFLKVDDKSFKFIFDQYFLEPNRNRFAYLVTRTFEFKVGKIIVDGKIDF